MASCKAIAMKITEIRFYVSFITTWLDLEVQTVEPISQFMHTLLRAMKINRMVQMIA